MPQIWESTGPATLTFTTQDLPSSSTASYLGALVEDSTLTQHLWNQCQQLHKNNNHHYQPAATITLKPHTHLQTIHLHHNHHPDHQGVTLQYHCNQHHNLHSVNTKLLVAADGANSFVRRYFNMPVLSYGYGRKALTCTVQLAQPMPSTAFQRMEPNGPIALLPTYHPNYATLVWSTTPDICNHWQQLHKQSNHSTTSSSTSSTSSLLVHELNRHLQTGPQVLPNTHTNNTTHHTTHSTSSADALAQLTAGLTMKQWNDRQPFQVPPKIHSIAGPVLSFDLNMMQARQYALDKHNVLLVGDAAHTVHPMAGQGLNLGLGDVHTLVQLYQQSLESGMIFSSTQRTQYQTQRQLAVSSMQLGIHTLHELYRCTTCTTTTNNNAITSTTASTGGGMSLLNSLGMNLVNTVSPLRSILAQIATGTLGLSNE